MLDIGAVHQDTWQFDAQLGEYLVVLLPQAPLSPNNRLHLQPPLCLMPTESVFL